MIKVWTDAAEAGLIDRHGATRHDRDRCRVGERIRAARTLLKRDLVRTGWQPGDDVAPRR